MKKYFAFLFLCAQSLIYGNLNTKKTNLGPEYKFPFKNKYILTFLQIMFVLTYRQQHDDFKESSC